MTISFHPTTSPLFIKLGKIIFAAETLDTARATTVPPEFEDIADQYATGSLELQAIPDRLAAAVTAWRGGGNSMMTTLRDMFRATIIRYVKEDEQQPSDSLEDALRELIRQMNDWPDAQVENNLSLTAEVSSLAAFQTEGKGVIAVSANALSQPLNRHGVVAAYCKDETITIECVDDTTEGAEAFRFRGQLAADKMSDQWFTSGSGCDVSITAAGPLSRSNKVTNASFETADTIDATLPQGWIRGESNAGALTTLSAIGVQTVVISGTPTGGTYKLKYTDTLGYTHYTVPLVYNASGSTVQAALRSISTLGSVTVETSGSTPNYTHTVTMTGVRNPSTLSYVSSLTGGAPVITPTVTTANPGTSSHGARAVKFSANGTATGRFIIQKLTNLAPSTCYALCFSSWLDGVGAAGVLRVMLVDSANSGSTIVDEQGTANSTTFAYTTMTDGLVYHTVFFRTPAVLPDAVYLTFDISTAFTNAVPLYIDSVVFAEATSLYDGGPLVAVFPGHAPWELGDTLSLEVENTYGDQIQQYFNRFCDMEQLDLMLASDGTGVTNEVQTITSTHTSGSTGTFSFDGQTTAAVNFNASAATIQSRLEALSNIGAGNVACAGGALNAAPITVTFQGALAAKNVSLITFTVGNFAGGALGIVQTTAGVNQLANGVFVS